MAIKASLHQHRRSGARRKACLRGRSCLRDRRTRTFARSIASWSTRSPDKAKRAASTAQLVTRLALRQ
jgi:hypothetical protein